MACADISSYYDKGQARVQGGGAPLEIEKQKKRSSEQILSYFTYILLLFQSKRSFSQLFFELALPEKLKSKKKEILSGGGGGGGALKCF